MGLTMVYNSSTNVLHIGRKIAIPKSGLIPESELAREMLA